MTRDSQSSESVIDVFHPPIDDTNDGKTLPGNRHSYIYSGKLGAGSTNAESPSYIGNQNGGPQRVSQIRGSDQGGGGGAPYLLGK